jgi:hypothetical protein
VCLSGFYLLLFVNTDLSFIIYCLHPVDCIYFLLPQLTVYTRSTLYYAVFASEHGGRARLYALRKVVHFLEQESALAFDEGRYADAVRLAAND